MKSILPLLFSWKGTVRRDKYLLWGSLLFFVKFNIDRVISLYLTNDTWYWINYLVGPNPREIELISETKQTLYIWLIVVALPFVWMGLMLTLKRLRSAGLPLAVVFCFFIPFVNILTFAILSVIPEKDFSTVNEQQKPSFLKRLIPQSRWGNAAFAFLFTVVIALMLVVFSIHALKSYGVGLFLGVPFFLGFSSSLLYGYHHQRTLRECLGVAFSSVLLCSLFMLALALEGVICLLMVFPIGLLLAGIGALLGYVIQVRRPEKEQFISIVIIGIPLLMGAEYVDQPLPETYAVTTSLLIHAPAEKVWDNVISFPSLEEPKELIFKAGIAYPISAEIKGSGPGAVRCCVFNTGKFVEPIEVWDEARLLRFSVSEQPEPLRELTPYKKIKAPHLHGYFASSKGEFLLIPQKDGGTILQGTTWYHNKIWPAVYWKIWSDYMLHTIHLRVLQHIKQESER